jgi:hypothetical protein
MNMPPKRPPGDAGSIVLRGLPVPLDSDVGGAFISDCARHTEDLLTDEEIKSKWGLDDREWEGLSENAPLVDAVRAERDRRVRNGDAAREAAQRHFAKAPAVLNEILNDELASPRHRIEAAKELRAAAGAANLAKDEEKVTIIIDLGPDHSVFREVSRSPITPKTGLPAPKGEDDEPL